MLHTKINGTFSSPLNIYHNNVPVNKLGIKWWEFTNANTVRNKKQLSIGLSTNTV